MTSAEVVVYGATSAGVCAAVAAAESGLAVLLVEPGRHVGGMTTGGLGYTDVGDLRVVGGPARRLRQDIADYYGVAPGRYAGPEPHVAERIYLSWLEQAGVDVLFEAPLQSVDAADGCIRGLIVGEGEQARRVAGVVFIDASYEGDLLAGAGVPFAVGREDIATHAETLAGRREVVPGMHAMPPWISPFVGTDESSGVLPQIRSGPMVPVGEGDGGIMSYGYRVCLTTAADRIPFTRREGYRAEDWELGRRLFARWAATGVRPEAGRMLGLEPNLPGGKCDGNSLGPFSLSVLDGSAWEYPEASPARREEIRLAHLHHAEDFLYFLSHDDAVPVHIRDEMARWGLPADEFADTGHLPHQLYIREARRMVGEYVLTQHDLAAARPQYDTVAMGSYHIDIREVQRTWYEVYEHPAPVPMVVTEGYLSVAVPPYPVPYRSLVPRYRDCRNLIVPVCLSASHVAFSSIRMEVQYQMLGHAAGRAAAAAVASDRPVQRIDIGALQRRLTDDGQVLALP